MRDSNIPTDAACSICGGQAELRFVRGAWRLLCPLCGATHASRQAVAPPEFAPLSTVVPEDTPVLPRKAHPEYRPSFVERLGQRLEDRLAHWLVWLDRLSPDPRRRMVVRALAAGAALLLVASLAIPVSGVVSWMGRASDGSDAVLAESESMTWTRSRSRSARGRSDPVDVDALVGRGPARRTEARHASQERNDEGPDKAVVDTGQPPAATAAQPPPAQPTSAPAPRSRATAARATAPAAKPERASPAPSRVARASPAPAPAPARSARTSTPVKSTPPASAPSGTASRARSPAPAPTMPAPAAEEGSDLLDWYVEDTSLPEPSGRAEPTADPTADLTALDPPESFDVESYDVESFESGPPASVGLPPEPEVLMDRPLAGNLVPGQLPDEPGTSTRAEAPRAAEVADEPASAARGDRVVVRLHSLPSGAEVGVDGRMRGRTPVKLMLEPGRYQIDLQLGDAATSIDLKATADQRLCFDASGATIVRADCGAILSPGGD